MPSGPNSESPNSESGMADGGWRVPHDDWTLGANHVSRAPESGWPIPLPVISGLATGPPAGVGDGLRFLSRRANTSCPSSDRFRLRELRESQHFSTFYGPSVQALDTEPGVRQGRRTPAFHRDRAPRLTPHISGGSRRCKVRQVVVIRGLRWLRLALLLGPGRSGPRHGF